MKKHFIIVALLTGIFLWKGFLFGQNMMYYTSESYHFTVQLPEEWKRNDEVRSEKVALVMVSEAGASVSIAYYKLNGGSSEEFIDRYEASLPGIYEVVNLQEKGVLKSRDDEATYLVYDFQKDGEMEKEKVCFFIHDQEMVLITANHSATEFHNALPVFNKIFKSFTFETDQEKVEE